MTDIVSAPLTWGILILSPKINNQESHRDLWPSQAGIHVIKLLLYFEISLGLNQALCICLFPFCPQLAKGKPSTALIFLNKENIKLLTAASQHNDVQVAFWKQ